MTDDEWKAEFWFLREDIYTLHDIMKIPEMLTCYNGVKVTGIEVPKFSLKDILIHIDT